MSADSSARLEREHLMIWQRKLEGASFNHAFARRDARVPKISRIHSQTAPIITCRSDLKSGHHLYQSVGCWKSLMPVDVE